MPVPVKDQILAALAGVLEGVPGMSAATVFRDDPNPEIVPCLVYREEHEEAPDESQGFGLELHRMSVAIEGFVAAAAAAAQGPARAVLEADTRRAVLANRGLAGAHDIRQGDLLLNVDTAEGHGRNASFTLGLVVEWFTPTGDPYTIG